MDANFSEFIDNPATAHESEFDLNFSQELLNDEAIMKSVQKFLCGAWLKRSKKLELLQSQWKKTDRLVSTSKKEVEKLCKLSQYQLVENLLLANKIMTMRETLTSSYSMCADIRKSIEKAYEVKDILQHYRDERDDKTTTLKLDQFVKDSKKKIYELNCYNEELSKAVKIESLQVESLERGNEELKEIVAHLLRMYDERNAILREKEANVLKAKEVLELYKIATEAKREEIKHLEAKQPLNQLKRFASDIKIKVMSSLTKLIQDEQLTREKILAEGSLYIFKFLMPSISFLDIF